MILGFNYMWGGKFDLAEKWISDSFKSTAQTGDIVLESRRPTYLTVIHRRRGNVETARCYAERGLFSAASARMIEYVGMAKGNRAWVNLRDGEPYPEAGAMIESTVRLLLRCGVRQQ